VNPLGSGEGGSGEGERGGARPEPKPVEAPRRRRRWHWSLDVALVIVLFVGLQAWLTRDVVRGALPAIEAPLAMASVADAQSWRQRYGRDGFVLYVWATWCAMCRTIEGGVDAVARDSPVLTLAMQSGPPSAVAAELARRGLTWPTLVDERGEQSRRLGVDAVPMLLFVDRHGNVRTVTRGFTTSWGIRARLWWAQRGR